MTLPAVDSLSTVGGAKENYAPVEDSTTDENAEHRNIYAANATAMTQTLCRAIYRFKGKASSPPDDATASIHFSVWGNDVSVKPTTARTGTGVFTITYPATVDDELGETHSTNLISGWGNAESSTFYHVQVAITSPNVATVYVFDAAGAATDAVGVTIAVFLR